MEKVVDLFLQPAVGAGDNESVWALRRPYALGLGQVVRGEVSIALGVRSRNSAIGWAGTVRQETAYDIRTSRAGSRAKLPDYGG